MNSLFPDPTTCVVCFHAGHPRGMCQDAERADNICGCTDYVTEEQRGQRIVPDPFVKAQRFQQWADDHGVGRIDITKEVEAMKPDPYAALIADLQTVNEDNPLDPGVVGALATFWKSKVQAQRATLLEIVWDWISRSHANFPEHDHHCRADAKPEAECTCGYTAAKDAMEGLDRLDAAADKA